MTVQGQATTGNVLGPGVAGAMSGKTPGVRQNDTPKPGELPQTPWEIEGPYYRLGTPQRSNLLEPGTPATPASTTWSATSTPATS
jgi:hypothetical protein